MKWDERFRRRRWERRMDAELRFHLDSQISDYVSRGLSREEAELRARREFGAVDLAKDECRDQRPFEWLDLSCGTFVTPAAPCGKAQDLRRL